jgi:hypothetical protein
VFYFIFVAVGAVLLKERQEDRQRQGVLSKQLALVALRGTRTAHATRAVSHAPSASPVPQPAADVLKV